MERKCPKCGNYVDDGRKYCVVCGWKVDLEYIEHPTCPKCRREFPVGMLYCDTDGCKLVSPDKLVPKCEICGQVYDENVKFCPKDGGAVTTEASRAERRAAHAEGYKAFKASLWKRFLACLIDTLIGWALAIPAIAFFGIAFVDIIKEAYYYGDISPVGYGHSILSVILALLLCLLPLAYFMFKDGMKNGQSWGKRAVGLQVICTRDNAPCTYGKSFLRNIVYCLLNCIPYVGWLIEPLMVLCSDDGRRVGDRAAETRVVELPE